MTTDHLNSMDRTPRWPDRLVKALAVMGAGFGTYLVVDQGFLTVGRRLADGDSLLTALLDFVSFLSILTNTALVAIYLWSLSGARVLRWNNHPSYQAFMGSMIVMVGVSYHVLLAPSGGLDGTMSFADIGLHYVTPVMYLVWWWLRSHEDQPRYGPIHRLMILPLAYAIWLLARGALTGRYPYPFIDVGVLGYSGVLPLMIGLLLSQWALTLLMVAIRRRP